MKVLHTNQSDISGGAAIDPNAQRRRQFINIVINLVKPGAGSSIEFLKKRTWTYPVANLNEIIKQAAFVILVVLPQDFICLKE